MDIKIVPPHVYAAALAYYTGPSQYVEEELLPAALEKGADLFPYTEEEDTLPPMRTLARKEPILDEQ